EITMIKIIITFTKIVIAFVIALVVVSCQFTGIAGDGNVITKTRNIEGDFTGVEVNRGLEVVVMQSDTQSVTVEADSNLHHHILTTVNNGMLTITSDENISNAEVLKIIVKMPVLSRLATTGGSSLKSGNVLLSESLTISASSG